MESEMNTELVCVMASLGYYDEDNYYMGEDCIESLKDLIRFLRKEEENCDIRRQMGAAHLVQKDLIPMLIHLGENEELVDIVIRLLVNLTSPVDICFNKNADVAEEEGNKNKITNTFQTKRMEVISHLQAYKKAFTSGKTLAAVGCQLGRILQMDVEERTENNLVLFERLLLLIRNILHVPASPEEEQRTDDDASLHDQVLWNMHINGIDELLVYISSSEEEGRWTMHIMEIIFLIFREQNPEVLAKSSAEKSESEKAAIANDMILAKEKEEAITNVSRKQVYNSRHSRFGGTFWVKNMKGIGQMNTLVHHKIVKDPKDITFDEKKQRRRVPKRLQPLKPTEQEKRSTLKIRLFLKEFCKKFLELSYNLIMRQVKDNVVAKKTQENDDTYYIWAIKFFMEFNRAHLFKVEYVSETINLNTFHYILKQLNLYYDQFLMHKRGGWEPWSTRLHKSLQTYKELLTYILNMDQSQDSVLKNASSVIKNNIFYHEEYRNIFLVLLRHYMIRKHTERFLSDLIDTFHVFIKLLEGFCKTKGSLLVSSKRKVQKKKKRNQSDPVTSMTAEELDKIWEDNLAPALSGHLQGYEPIPEITISPLDHSSDIHIDEQKMNAIMKIQDLLRSKRSGEAVSLLRAARECWRNDSQLGLDNLSPEEEFGLFRNLLTMEIERPVFEELNEEEAGHEDEEEEEANVRSVEREFHLNSFLMSLASPKMIQPYCLQLKKFKESSAVTNHSVIRMMHRIAVDMKFPEMFYQVSLFITFKEILEINLPIYKELHKFANYILFMFTEVAKSNTKIYVECLFWKTTGDCYNISYREPPQKTMTQKWTIEDEQELKTLFDQYRNSDNVVDEILESISDKGRTRRQVINKLVAMECVANAKELPAANKKQGDNWTYEEEEELKGLFDQFKESEDIVGDILKNLTNGGDRSRRKVVNKLVRLRLIEKGKDLPKPPKAPKPPKWSSEQTEELHRLYDENKESDDILANIMVSMPFKKSKMAIVKHLIETGKVLNKAELYKKKKKNNLKNAFKDMVMDVGEGSEDNEHVRKRNVSSSDEEEKIYDNWSDEDDGSPISNKKGRVISSSEDEADEEDNLADNISNLISMVKTEFPQQIIWLQTRLKRAADDREEDSDWYAVPLLTMTEDDDLAMQDKSFKKLLLAIGIRPPIDEQETFWRIDIKLSPQKLRTFSDQLENIVREPNKVSNVVESDVSEMINDKPANPILGKRVKRQFLSSDSEDEDKVNQNDSNKEKENSSVKDRMKRKRILLDEDSDDDENDSPEIDDSVSLNDIVRKNDITEIVGANTFSVLRDSTNLDSDNDLG